MPQKAPPLRDGEGMVIADLDMSLITKRKRMKHSVGQYARPELLSLLHDASPATPLAAKAPNLESVSHESADPDRTAPDRHPAVDSRGAVAGPAAR